jgi:subtilisin family serine protease
MPVVADLPVHEPYLRALESRGARVRGASRWLNAASVEIPAGLAPELARMSFVRRMERVPVGRPMRRVAEGLRENYGGLLSEPVPGGGGDQGAISAAAMPPGDPSFYGGSFRQLDMMQVPALHAQGLSGAGVLVCMLDTGFTLTHEAFAGLDVVATRDFINGDLNVDDQTGQDIPGQADHGSWTLACVAGHKPGTYIGGAFAASVALAKTEHLPSESPVEMDYWQFAAEWADSLGADVISSSLGYSEFDNPGDSYTYADMDGRTTVVALAAVEAMRRGITVVTAAGNEGTSPWFYILSPGDADSIVTVGAVDSFNVVASFSSHGPTSDNRIKPDVTAMGRQVLTIVRSLPTTYTRLNGTSFATPLTAGVVALLLEAHPTWRPIDVREALRGTALNQATPNNTIGWGLVQGLDALAWIPVAVDPPSVGVATGLRIAAGPNPVRAGISSTVRFSAPVGDAVALDVVDLAGRRRARLFEGEANGERSVTWAGTGASGARLPPGIYWLQLTRSGPEGGAAAAPTSRSAAMRVVLLP